MASPRPNEITIKDFYEKVYAYRNDKEQLHLFIKNCHAANLADIFKHDNDPSCVLWHAILTNDITKLSAKKLLQARNALELDPHLLFQNSDPKNSLLPTDPTDIIEIIKLVIEAIIIIMRYLEASNLCKKKEGTEKLIEALKLTSTQNGKNIFINLAGATIQDLNLDGINLNYSALDRTKWKNTSLQNVCFDCASLEHVTFSDCNLSGATFHGTHLNWADLSDSIVDANAFGDIDLNRYLRTKFPVNVKPNVSNLSPEEILKSLTFLQEEFEHKKKQAKENCPWLAFANKLERQTAHHIVANSIANLSDLIKDPQAKHDFLLAAIKHDFFADHLSARFVKGFNSVFTGIHDLFSRHKKDIPILGNHSQNIMIRKLKEAEHAMPTHILKPHCR